MLRVMRHVLIALVIALTAQRAQAFTTIVPDNFPSIQAAHDAGATTIQVRAGSFVGNVNLTHDVTVVPMPDPANPGLPIPYIKGTLTISPPDISAINTVVRGMRIQGLVTVRDRTGIGNNGNTVIEDCRLDAGLTIEKESYVYIRHNLVTAGGIHSTSGNPWVIQLDANTVVGGIDIFGAEGSGHINGNFVIAPGATGIRWTDSDSDISGADNIVYQSATGMNIGGGAAVANQVLSPTTDGIVAPAGGVVSQSMYNNIVTNSGGRGIACAHSPSLLRFNYVAGAAGNGIEVSGTTRLTDNRVEDAAGTGILCPGGSVDSVSRNVVLRSGGPGINLVSVENVTLNVVGRSGGDGIRALVGPGTNLTLRKNTSYLNGQDAYDLTADGASVTQNIAHANLGFGLRLAGAGATLSCNDWYSNTLGMTTGVAAGGTDVNVNPMFCDLPHDVVTLSMASPLASGPCAVVGAMPVVCLSAVGVGPEQGSLELAVSPSPARGTVSFRFGPSGPGATLEVFDAAGALRWRESLAEGSTEVRWRLVDHAGGPLPGGVYFARLSDHGARHNARVVVTR